MLVAGAHFSARGVLAATFRRLFSARSRALLTDTEVSHEGVEPAFPVGTGLAVTVCLEIAQWGV